MKFGRKTGLPKIGAGETPDPDPDAPRSEREAPGSQAGSRAASAKSRQPPRKGAKRGYLDGQMLIAMPTMGDERFARSVIYVCAHSSDGAMGIIINHPASHISFRDLLVQLDVVKDSDKIQLPPPAY